MKNLSLKSYRGRLGLLCFVLAMGTAFSVAQQAHTHRAQAGAAPAAESAVHSGPSKISIPDVLVLDQNNRRVHFYSDLIKGKAVAINFIFTTCTTICPPMTANFAKVQKTMLAHGEKDFHLISVSVDPENDTPAKLKAYAEMFHAQPGWTFVTGTRAELEPVWKAFSVFSGGAKEDHPATVVIGNDAQHTWTYASGLTSATKLVNAITIVLDGKNSSKAVASGN